MWQVLTRKCRSLGDQDTDRWVFEVLAPDIRRKLKDITGDFAWTDLVLARSHIHTRDAFSYRCLRRAQGLRELHEQGATREDIEGALRIMPVVSSPAHSSPHLLTLYQHPAMIRGVKTIKAAVKPQTTFLCLSNANTVYISTVLEVCAVGRLPSHHHLINR